MLVVLWRRRYKCSLRDLAEMFLERAVVCSHDTVRDREARFVPSLTARLRAERRGQGGMGWHADGASSKIDGRWCYRYRAIDRAGLRVDVLHSDQRDMAAARRCFARAAAIAGCAPG